MGAKNPSRRAANYMVELCGFVAVRIDSDAWMTAPFDCSGFPPEKNLVVCPMNSGNAKDFLIKFYQKGKM